MSFALERSQDAPAEARRAVAQFLPDVPAHERTDIQLAVTELVANAVVHGSGAVRVKLRRVEDRVRIEVIDEGDGAADVQRVRAHGTVGTGLHVVDAVSIRWGAFEGTTHVWCEIPLDG